MLLEIALLLLVGLAAPVEDAKPASGKPLRVVATIPDLADITREIGGERVEVSCLARGTQNIHAVNLQPSHLVAMRRADVFIEVGLSLEHAFVPGILMSSRNRKIEPGLPGFIQCSTGWEAINVPPQVDRGIAADVHPMGNPHMNLDPRAGRFFAERILEGLSAVEPASREYFVQRHGDYVRRLAVAEERWSKLGARLKGKKVVTYHRDMVYFARAYGIEVVDNVEPQPGVPPTARDLAETIKIMKQEGVGVVLSAKWSNNQNTRFVAEKAGARVVEVPLMVGGVSRTETWIGMMDFLHEELVNALAPED